MKYKTVKSRRQGTSLTLTIPAEFKRYILTKKLPNEELFPTPQFQ